MRFFKGWFDHTLPAYSPPPHDVLVVNVDADLSSSTLCVLQEPAAVHPAGTLNYVAFECVSISYPSNN